MAPPLKSVPSSPSSSEMMVTVVVEASCRTTSVGGESVAEARARILRSCGERSGAMFSWVSAVELAAYRHERTGRPRQRLARMSSIYVQTPVTINSSKTTQDHPHLNETFRTSWRRQNPQTIRHRDPSQPFLSQRPFLQTRSPPHRTSISWHTVSVSAAFVMILDELRPQSRIRAATSRLGQTLRTRLN